MQNLNRIGKKGIFKFPPSFFILILILTFSIPAKSQDIQPEKFHSYVDKTVSRLLSRFHYSQLELSDSLSSEIYDRYIGRLDANRNYFLAADVKKFEKYRYALDDAILEGKTHLAYEIFNKFKERVGIRITKVPGYLEKGFDFTLNEDIVYNEDEIPWASTEQELDEKWRKSIKNQALNLKLAGKDEGGIKDVLTKRYQNIERRINQYDSEEVFELFMNAYSQSLDPHTNYFSPITSDNFAIRMSLSFEGIGARLTPENEYTKIFEIIPGGPADLDKRLQVNDYIIGVDEHNDGNVIDVVGWKLDDVVKHIRGKKGSEVRLQIIPGGDVASAKPRFIVLTRDKVKLEAQAAKSDTIMIESDNKKFTLGVIEIPTFYFDFEAQARNDKHVKSTTADVKKLITKLEGQGIDGLIIDLRSNGGGSLQEAIRLTGLFIDRGPVVQVRQSTGYIEVEKDTEKGLFYNGPLLVLVNEYSASASEIFSAAIQDYGRGLIAGSQTFGKGTVQQLVSLDRFIPGKIAGVGGGGPKFGRLKVTMAKFYRVDGGSTQHRGVVPDIMFPSRHNPVDFGESAQSNALVWDQIPPTPKEKYAEMDRIIPKLRTRHNLRIADTREFKYLREDIEKYKKTRADNRLSLQEAKRKKEREEAEAIRLRRENERRADSGLPPLKKDDEEKEKLELRDFLRDEGAHILVDFILLADNKLLGKSGH